MQEGVARHILRGPCRLILDRGWLAGGRTLLGGGELRLRSDDDEGFLVFHFWDSPLFFYSIEYLEMTFVVCGGGMDSSKNKALGVEGG